MDFIDTRGRAPVATFAEVISAGTGYGGGLFVPEKYPPIDFDLALHWDYPSLGTHSCYPFMEGWISWEELDRITHEVYSATNFGTPEIAPIEWLEDNLGLLDLSRGPTRAFKDLPMMLVAALMDFDLGRRGQRATIVVSTSGDTGGAAVEAFRKCKHVDLIVLYPEGRISAVQRLMMTTAQESHIHALAVAGTFDDCQAMVKAMFKKPDFVQKYRLGGVNSINIVRIIAQMVYWAWCSVQVLKRGHQHVRLSVPTGNFGNAFSADGTRRRGAPISRIIVATNENDVLHRAFVSGIYEKAAEVYPASSNSMNIQVASNFERLLFENSGREGGLIGDLMDEFELKGRCDLRIIRPSFLGGWESGRATESEVFGTIREVHRRYGGRIIDPHTAVAMRVGKEYLGRVPLIVAETAKPEKFPDAIRLALGDNVPLPTPWKHLETLPERINYVDNHAEEVMNYIKKDVR